jgi:hypothetical protein
MEPITITLTRRQRIARKYSSPCRVASYVPGGHGRYHKEKSNRVSLYRSSRPRLESSQSGHHQCAYGCEAASLGMFYYSLDSGCDAHAAQVLTLMGNDSST